MIVSDVKLALKQVDVIILLSPESLHLTGRHIEVIYDDPHYRTGINL